MSNRTEKDQGFGQIEMRANHGDFPGWRGLQRTGDTVLKPGRFFRAWNAQINDGDVSCRGGQTPFSDMSTASTRPHCITSIFSTNVLWPDLGERAEIRLTLLAGFHTQQLDEPSASGFSTYRGDAGFDIAGGTVLTAASRQAWLRDGVNNTSSGAVIPSGGNTSIRIRDRVYVAFLDGSIKYLSPGTASYTTLAAAGAQFGAGSRPLAMLYRAKLVVVGDGVMKEYDIDAGSWSTPAMPGGTIGFCPKGWTVFDTDACLYVWGTVGDDVKLLKYDGTTVSVTYSLVVGGSILWYQAIDCASNNGNIVVTYVQQDNTIISLEASSSTDGISFSNVTSPVAAAGQEYNPGRMVVADGMIWSMGSWSEGTNPDPILMNSYDGTEWVNVLPTGDSGGSDGVYTPVDIVEIATGDISVEDSVEL